MDLDTAIIGGGVSGVYCGWRFENEDPVPTYGIFESSDRIGGRLLTRTLPGMPNVPGELGGMRYIPSTQPLISAVIDELGLPSHVFNMGNPDPTIGPNDNLLYLRGRHLRWKDLADPSKVPYEMSWSEQGRTMDELQVHVMNMLVPDAADLSLDDWFQVEVFGKPLYEYGFWNLLYDVLTSEGYAFMRDAGGYEATVANANAVAQLPAAEYGPGTKFRAVDGGFETLPRSLAQAIGRAGRVHLNHRLESFHREGERYLLTFVKTVTDAWKTTDHSPREEVSVTAANVILALPRRSIELIDWEHKRDPQFATNLSAVVPQTALKLLLGYEYPWWKPLGLEAGVSVTDMPIRQALYFGTESDHGGNPDNHSSLLLGSYNDMGTIPFWKALEAGPAFEGHATAWMDRGEEPVPETEHTVTQGMVAAAQRQLRVLHDLQTIPDPYTAIYHEWSGDPYGGGWHRWRAGFKFNEVMKHIRKPIDGERVFICGEAYSNNQGWAEGALQTAEHVLRDGFGMAEAEWMHGAPIGP